MARLSSSEIIEELASEISIDASYFRKEADRLYLSGIEIALIIATGAVNSFVLGLIKGAKKGISKRGEKLGERLVDSLISRLTAIGKKIVNIDATDADKVVGELKSYQAELDGIMNNPELVAIAIDARKVDQSIGAEEIEEFLKEVGYPRDNVRDRATRLFVRIRPEWPAEAQ